jgi:hypothetical protein
MRRLGFFAAMTLATIMLTMAGTARASHRCTLDLSALVSVHSAVNVQAEPDNAPWPPSVRTTSDLLISAGGAATLMRTDTPFEATSQRTFISGQIPNQLSTQIRTAVTNAAAGPLPDCYVPSDLDPPTGESTKGFRYITLYAPFSVTVFRIQHADPDETLLPNCTPPVEALERVLQTAERALRQGQVRPLQCSPR